ncbi:MAG: Uma2 family endonuclease [Microcoleus sp. PH2017_29_MFU_D_A]|uniref:Uma2 family endonuclease n=1 Tax=unclassified Microcoleus TaxID=2642155 RepID=UPI001DCD4C5C|nr:MULTISPECIES: Uma2 family endonuclease [unclassified Microcoleus]MCC3606755.1 Uma2 family endonuclease [Microcoleus sp. PH2017_29_MFU_D_A]MCC3637806.1 Uma2 family endonuclease [Microcoleus sp. PH2017_37_MFU_D_B]
MVANQSQNYISPEEYLKLEELSQIKHEYIQGEIYARAGASDAHVTVAGNLLALLRNHVRGSGCRAYMSDMKARIESRNIYYYPDVMVTCDERDKAFQSFKRHPCLIIEVLSTGTEGFDRGDKFADYQELETLQEYVLISQKRQRVECFRRNAEGLWVLYSYTQGSEIHLASVDFRTSMDSIYEDVIFTNESQSAIEIATTQTKSACAD